MLTDAVIGTDSHTGSLARINRSFTIDQNSDWKVTWKRGLALFLHKGAWQKNQLKSELNYKQTINPHLLELRYPGLVEWPIHCPPDFWPPHTADAWPQGPSIDVSRLTHGIPTSAARGLKIKILNYWCRSLCQPKLQFTLSSNCNTTYFYLCQYVKVSL